MQWVPYGSAARAPRVHFIGIGGTAMVAGARLAIEAGWEVRGSDVDLYPPASDMVKVLHVPVATGFAAENLEWTPDIVIIGNALSRGNAEVEAVLEKGLHYTSLPEWLKDTILRRRKPVVIAGTHGKTTTTALTAFLLEEAGAYPGFLIGGQPLDFEHSARLGREGGPFVVEGDEYDTAFFDKRAKFFHYLPHIAVVTSLEFDHGDIYRDIEEIELAFQRMLRQIPRSGHLIVCSDSPRALALASHAFCPVSTYGFGTEADWRIELVHQEGPLAHFMLHHLGMLWGHFMAPLAGRHNLQNVAAAIAVAASTGASPSTIADALPSFRGIKRRMEVFHETGGVIFVDDFAHHPTAMRETIAAARLRWPHQRLIVLFEPRSNTTVTNRFQGEIIDALAVADEVWLGPIHRAEKIPVESRLDREAICVALDERNVIAHYAEGANEIVERLKGSIAGDSVVLVLSNGAFGGIYELLRRAFP